MEPHIFQSLTSSTLDQYAIELDHAAESHAHWTARVNRALVFGVDIPQDDISETPHLRCHFGRWYHSLEDSALLDIPEFAAIGAVHAQVHGAARAMLLKRHNGQVPDTKEYDHFVRQGEELRRLIHSVRQALKQNLGVVSRLMAKVFENATEGVVITTPDGTILNVNRAFTEVTGYTPQEAIGQTPHLLYSGRQDKSFYEKMWQTLNSQGQWQGEIWNRRKNGDVYLEWLSINSVKNERDQVTHYVAIFTDITTEKENEQRLYRLAHYDPLTELPNRILFQDRFKQALARARRGGRTVAVMFLDLDGFKEVNDRHGHSAGDELLNQVAARLTRELRKTDTVGRLGGDEFAIILPDMDTEEGIAAAAQKVIDTIAQPFRLDGGEARITTSIGISRFPSDGMDTDNLIQRADTAMYEAKKSGKNRFCFYRADMN